MLRRPSLSTAWLPVLGLLISCGTPEEECFDDRSCSTGDRCVIETAGQPGICVECDPTETTYNGIDDDCNPRTRDVDLDGDGQNAVDSAFNPGMDCDDSDPLVFAGAAEICGDTKDNDCDGDIDERDCADLAAPAIRFLSPADGETISGPASLRIQIDDDVGATELVVRANNVEVGRLPLEPVPTRVEEITLATTSLPDGNITLRAEAVDLKERLGAAVITVNIDNSTPPEVVVGNPVADGYYGGLLTATATVTDPSGVSRVEIELDGTVTATLTAPPWRHVVDTSTLAEGAHDLLFRAFDTNLSQTTRRVRFFADNTGPRVRFGSPAPGQVVSGALLAVVTATDAAGVLEIRTQTATGSSPLTFTIGTTALPNGSYLLSASAEDLTVVDDGNAPGNVASATVTFTINNVDPTPMITFTNPLAADGVLGVTPLAVDVVSLVGNPIAEVSFAVDGVSVGTSMMAPFSVVHDFSVNTGTVSVVATALDAQGNQGTAEIVVDVVPLPNFRVASRAGILGGLGATGGIAVSDVNADGHMDVVTGGNELVVFTGTIGADGQWILPKSVSAGRENLIDVRVMDLDGDGLQDAIGFSSGEIKVFTGTTAEPYFLPPTTFMVEQTGMAAFDVGDIDGDLDADVVIAGGNVAGIVGYTYLRDASGNYTLGQNLGGDNGASDVQIGDIDADGDADVIVGRSTTALVTLFLNGGIGNFGAGRDTATFAAPRKVAIADMTGEGRVDVVAMFDSGFQVLPVLSTSPFNIVAGLPVPSSSGSPQSLAVADIVGNNLNDVVVATPNTNGMHVVANGAAGATGFATDESYILANRFSDMQLADLDGDNLLDVIGLSPSDGELVWARNIGGGKFLAAISVNAPQLTDPMNPMTPIQLVPSALDTGNVIGSPATDLVVTFVGPNQTPPQMVLFERAGTGLGISAGFALPASIDAPSLLSVGGTSATSGYDYMVVGTTGAVMMAAPTALILEVIPPQVFSTPLTIDYLTAVKTGDVDNDGLADAVFAIDGPNAGDDGSLAVELNLSGVRGPFAFGEGAGSVAIGNLDSDPAGRIDYAIANTVSENVTVQLWTGTAFANTQYNAPTGLGAITTGLVNNDAFLDIIGLAGGNVAFVMEGDPTFGFLTPLTYDAGPSPSKITGGDFNGDGLFDIMTLNSGDKSSLMLARPQGGFFPPIPYSLGAGPVDFRTVDFDGDGRLDVIAVQSGTPSILLIYNNADTL